MLAFPPCGIGFLTLRDTLIRMLVSSLTSVSDSGRWPQISISSRWRSTSRPVMRSRLGTRQVPESVVSRSPAVMVTGIRRQGKPARRNKSTTGLPTPVASTIRVGRWFGARDKAADVLDHGGIIEAERQAVQVAE